MPQQEASPAGPDTQTLLAVRDLRVAIKVGQHSFDAVRGVDLDVLPSEVVGIVGESGSGKSLTAKAVMRLISSPIVIDHGEVLYGIEDVLAMSPSRLNKYRGGDVSMIFQSASTALNPLMRVGDQIAETLRIHNSISRRGAQRRAVDMLRRVGIPAPEARARSYPHEFSGGMAQRVMIAAAIANEPALLIADEPTTAVDATTQAQLIELLMDLKEDTGMAVMLITHDLGLVAGIASRIYVMYAGRIVETGPTSEIFRSPSHPYTRGLLSAAPSPQTRRGQRLVGIEGTPPDPSRLPAGCPYAPRCDWAQDRCKTDDPPLVAVTADEVQCSACWFAERVREEPLVT